MEEKKTVCVAGLGYIGLPTAALLANRGFKVYGYDVKADVVEIINAGKIHIVEPALDTFVRAAVSSQNLQADTKPHAADIFIIAVPTPFKENNLADLSYVEASSKAIAPFVKDGNLVILESTSPIGATEKVRDVLKTNGVNTDSIFIAHCPERVLPGQVMRELIENDRIVGGLSEESTQEVKVFYESFVKGEVLTTDARTAEMCKLVENASRDAQIAFANELSLICDKADINVWELIKLANHHPRVNILNPGVGVGGHCIAVDPWFLISEYPDQAKMMRSSREVNLGKTQWCIDKIVEKVDYLKSKGVEDPKVACFGLAFKPNIDDLRESPALYVTQYLKSKGVNVVGVEPNIKKIDGDLDLETIDEALDKADVIALLVGHKAFQSIDFHSREHVIDFCGLI